jgi:photosystem II stability/assembly factor-like uncharacterized protein
VAGARCAAPRRAWLLALGSACAAAAWAAAWAAAEPRAAAPPPPIPAEHARLAARSLLIAIAAAGERLVAVGDRGVVVLSDDRGVSWTQAASVPAQALLTGVCFFDARHGVAVGHDEVVLVTGDGGDHWKIAHYAPEAQRPLLDVWCGAGGSGIAVGAYSTYLVSADAGASWSGRPFRPSPAPRSAGAPRPARGSSGIEETGGGYHLNRIVGTSASRLYIAGEAGHLYRSDDAGASWQELASPYAGSFFDLLPLGGDALLASGLRGNLYRSEDGGHSWQRLETGTVALLAGGALLPNGGVAMVGLSGVVLVSRDGGRSFTLEQQSDRSGLSAALAVGTRTLVLVGEGGARLLTLGGGTAAGAGAGP